MTPGLHVSNLDFLRQNSICLYIYFTFMSFFFFSLNTEEQTVPPAPGRQRRKSETGPVLSPTAD